MADVMHELRNLAVPFGLMLAKNGMDYLKSKKTTKASKPKASEKKPKKVASKTSKKPSKTASKSMKGGECPCNKTMAKLGGSSCGMPSMSSSSATKAGGSVATELSALSSRLNNLVQSYGGRS